MSDERAVTVIARAVQWFDFEKPEDPLSLARVILAQLRAKGFDVTEQSREAAGE